MYREHGVFVLVSKQSSQMVSGYRGPAGTRDLFSIR